MHRRQSMPAQEGREGEKVFPRLEGESRSPFQALHQAIEPINVFAHSCESTQRTSHAEWIFAVLELGPESEKFEVQPKSFKA